MKSDLGDRYWRWALPGSVALHLLIAAFLIFDLPTPLQQPAEEQAIAVELVPPQEEPAPAKEEPAKEEPKPEKPEEAKAESLPEGPAEAARAELLRPVFQFGERDAGPRQALDGNSAEDGGAPAAPQPDAASAEAAEAAARSTDAQRETPEAQALAAPEAIADSEQAEDVAALPTAPREAERQEAPEPGTENPATPDAVVRLPEKSETPTPKPTDTEATPSAPKLQPAERLYSQSASGDSVATTAMSGLPRAARGGQLCVTELREQLLRGSPPYFPDLLPSYPLISGTVIEVANAAFRVRGRWFDLGFRCEVDANATKVLSFAFRVGAPLPRSEWVRRGLPQ